jgi:hypothetical protein
MYRVVYTTGKSKHRRTAIIPLYDDLRAVLARIPKRSTTVLGNIRRRPWTSNEPRAGADRPVNNTARNSGLTGGLLRVTAGPSNERGHQLMRPYSSDSAQTLMRNTNFWVSSLTSICHSALSTLVPIDRARSAKTACASWRTPSIVRWSATNLG